MIEKKHFIGLSMIVKDEVHCIERLLNSIYKYIDYYSIVDTGSGDGTQDVIVDFFKEKGVPGKLIQDTWDDNFSRVRNIALEDTEANCEFGFWLDADEEFKSNLTPEEFKKQLTDKDIYNLQTNYNNMLYARSNIWKTGKQMRWVGPVHEILLQADREMAVSGGVINGANVIIRAEGNSWLGDITEKYNNHAKILEEYIKENKDPRWLYYLANSYKDSKQYDKAIPAYYKRIEAGGGYQEEVSYSALMIARLSELSGKDFNTCYLLYTMALEMDPYRGEANNSLTLMCLRANRMELMFMNALYGMRYYKNHPSKYGKIMFIEDDVYRIHSLLLYCYACKNSGRDEEAYNAYWMLRRDLDLNTIHPTVKDDILFNERFFPKKEVVPVKPAEKPLPKDQFKTFLPRKQRRELERQLNRMNKANGKNTINNSSIPRPAGKSK